MSTARDPLEVLIVPGTDEGRAVLVEAIKERVEAVVVVGQTLNTEETRAKIAHVVTNLLEGTIVIFDSLSAALADNLEPHPFTPALDGDQLIRAHKRMERDHRHANPSAREMRQRAQQDAVRGRVRARKR